MHKLAELVSGKSVALVGNAKSILSREDGAFIDAHDVVIRMNLGIPEIIGHPASIGTRTTVWATAKFWRVGIPKGCELLLFMKLTELGERDWAKWATVDVPMERWPLKLEGLTKEFVGADAGTGIRLLWWLKTLSSCVSITPYGFDCWKTASHWSGRPNTPNHRPDLEAAAMAKLLK